MRSNGALQPINVWHGFQSTSSPHAGEPKLPPTYLPPQAGGGRWGAILVGGLSQHRYPPPKPKRVLAPPQGGSWRSGIRALLTLLCLSIASPAFAASIERPLPDAAQEQQAEAVFHELRCVVCEGQSVADSDATLAAQMRAEVRTRIAAGDTPDAVLAYFKANYGAQILMTPPLESSTALLWLAPLLLLILGGWGVYRATRRA